MPNFRLGESKRSKAREKMVFKTLCVPFAPASPQAFPSTKHSCTAVPCVSHSLRLHRQRTAVDSVLRLLIGRTSYIWLENFSSPRLVVYLQIRIFASKAAGDYLGHIIMYPTTMRYKALSQSQCKAERSECLNCIQYKKANWID